MKLLSLWHWWNFALLFANIGVSLLALIVLLARKHKQLLSLWVYLGYWSAGGVAQMVIAAITPIGSLLYWNITVVLSIGCDVLFFLLCAQVVDILIRRNDVARVKKVWLIGLPVAFMLVFVAGRLDPSRCIPALLSFDTLAAIICGFAIAATKITPDEDWLRGYGFIIAGISCQIITAPTLRILTVFFKCNVIDVVSPLASLTAMFLFLWAAFKTHAAIPQHGGSDA